MKDGLSSIRPRAVRKHNIRSQGVNSRNGDKNLASLNDINVNFTPLNEASREKKAISENKIKQNFSSELINLSKKYTVENDFN